MDYPSKNEEKLILNQNVTLQSLEHFKLKSILDNERVIKLQDKVKEVFSSEAINNYIIDIVSLTRSKVEDYSKYVAFGASPRASIAIHIASKAEALMNGRLYVIPADVREVTYPVLRHRIILNYEAEVDKVDTEEVIKRILNRTRAP